MIFHLGSQLFRVWEIRNQNLILTRTSEWVSPETNTQFIGIALLKEFEKSFLARFEMPTQGS
jgi:hypothetical protein